MVKAYTELICHSGNQSLFRAIEMSVLAIEVNRPLHIHAEGLRGTGKTTVMRAARDLLPPIERIRGCRYNCDPRYPHCPEHFYLTEDEIAAIGMEIVPMPFLEISHSAKIGTVVGSIDLAKLTDAMHPSASILPGTIPQAHRGIIFVDEINRLADTSPDLTDVLLDVMGTKPGRIQIEESGLPIVQLPVQVSVWAASNPDEEPGPLEHIRRQLSDRFDLVVRMGRPSETDAIHHILQQSQTYRNEPRRIICVDPMLEARQQQQRFQALGTVFDQVRMSTEIKNIIANIYLEFGLESLRAVEGMELCSRVYAALQNRQQVVIEDLMVTVPLVLAHRVDLVTLENILKYLDSMHFARSVPTVPPSFEQQKKPRMITGCRAETGQQSQEHTAQQSNLIAKLWHKLCNLCKGLRPQNHRQQTADTQNHSASAQNGKRASSGVGTSAQNNQSASSGVGASAENNKSAGGDGRASAPNSQSASSGVGASTENNKSAGGDGRASAPNNQSASSDVGTSAQNNKPESGGVGTSAQSAAGDPRKMVMQAPAEVARPLTCLSVGQYVTSEEDAKNQC